MTTPPTSALRWHILKYVLCAVAGIWLSMTVYRTYKSYENGTSDFFGTSVGTLERKPSTQGFEVGSTEWTYIHFNPRIESFDLNPMDKMVSWQMVINKDFDHPIYIRAGKSEEVDVGGKVEHVHFRVVSDKGPSHEQTAEFLLKRFPK